MAQVNAGRVRFVSRGEYNNTTQYYLFDLVNYEGSSYVAIGNTLGNLPTNTTYWQLIAEKGNVGSVGPVGPQGVGITSITKTATEGLVDTYTITYTNGTTSTFQITNGEDGETPLSDFNALKDRVSDVEDNQLHDDKEGTEIYIDDAHDSKVDRLELEKESSQETTNGNQLIDFSKMVMMRSDIGSCSFENDTLSVYSSGTRDNGAQMNILDIFQNNLGKTINFSVENIETIGDNNQAVTITTTYSDGTPTAATYLRNKNGARRTYTIPNNVDNMTAAYFRLYQNAGSTTSYEGTVKYVKPMLQFGIEDLNYEEYTGGQPSPNPDYPQEVKTVKGYENSLGLTDGTYQNNGITAVVNKGIITLNGTASSTSFVEINLIESLNFNNEEHFILLNNPTAVTDSNTQIRIQASSTEYIALPLNVVNNKTGWAGNRTYTSFLIRTSSGVTYNNFVIKPQIDKDTSLHPYVPYGNNYIDVKVTGKNLNTSDLETGSINGATGENQSNSSYTRSKDYIALQSNTEYTISSSIQALIGLRYYDKNKNFISTANATAQPKTFTTPENCYYIRYVLTINDLTNLIQIEEGSTATSYEAYKESIVTIPLNGNEIVGIGNYKDELIVDKEGHVWLDKKINKSILNENEDWTMTTAQPSIETLKSYQLMNHVPTRLLGEIPLLSTHFKVLGYSSGGSSPIVNAQNEGIIINRIQDRLYFISTIQDLTSFKDFIENNQVELYYVLENSDTIDLNTTVDLKLFKYVNNITNSEDANMRIRYVQDTQLLFNNFDERLKALEQGQSL
jgi:hypothetical protein